MNNTTQHPEELLPWYVNGTLTGAEKQSVDAHIQSCEKCQKEIELLKVMREQVKSVGAESPGELAKMRFMKEIKNASQSSTRDSLETGRKSWVQQMFAVAAVLIISVQAVFLFNMSGNLASNDPGKSTELASEKKDKNQPRIKIRFKSDATISRINQLLSDTGVIVKSGPDVDGFYMIDIDKDNKQSSGKTINDILSKLETSKKQKNSIIDYVDTP